MGGSIETIVKEQKCSSCGVCAGVCMKSAISIRLIKGIPTPIVDYQKCNGCSLCLSVCPGKSSIEEAKTLKTNDIKEFCVGSYYNAKIVQIKNQELLAKATSGGVVSELISTLLEERIFKAAFVVRANCFNKLTYTELCTSVPDLNGTEKSRYIPVSQEKAVRYMLSHREERLIITGTGCAIQGIINVINKCHLHRENYLLIGLFCDKLMSYKVWEYFSKQKNKKGGDLQELYFRDKGNTGWPGDIKLVFSNGTSYLTKKKRTEVKDLFCHPRCLYCVDKLNRMSDISVGDNYTNKHSDKKGSSCVIIRTPTGEAAYRRIADRCVSYPVEIDDICKSQEINKKKENGMFLKHRFSGERLSGRLWIKYMYKRIRIEIGKNGFRWLIRLFIKIDEVIKQKEK